MRKRRSAADILGLMLIITGFGMSAPNARADPGAVQSLAADLQLEVFINSTPRHLIAAFRRNADGSFAISPEQLRNIGLLPVDSALTGDGMILLERLPGVTYVYDKTRQTINFTAADRARAVEVIDARPKDRADLSPISGTGGLLNYTLFGNWQSEKLIGWPVYQGVSGYFDSRLFSSYGAITNSFIGRSGPTDTLPAYTRLDSKWSYSDPRSLTTYVAGDLISRGPDWSRPIRMAGFQVRSNFALRPDLVTMPIPSLAGSAAVPSTVDVLVNNSQVLSRDVSGGPFQINSLPVVSGPGTARLVIRDALGRETIQDTPYYASSSLLTPELTDYSLEGGFARTLYGIESDAYDRRFLVSASGRHGLSDTFTIQAHGEGGANLINAGIGGIFALNSFGIGTLSVAGSNFDGATGFLASASVEARFKSWTFYARSQRAFSNYADLASISLFDLRGSITPLQSQAQPPKALDQVALSLPIAWDRSSLSFSFTHLETATSIRSRIAGISYNRQFFADGSLFITGYKDFDRNGFGVFAGITMQLGERVSSSLGVQSSNAGMIYSAEATRPLSSAVDDYGWRVRLAEGQAAANAAAASYRLPSARLEAGVQAGANRSQVFGQADGAIVLMDRDIFFTNKIDDSFAVVDAGIPGVTVNHQNRKVGITDKSGKIVVPTLQSWEANEISIDPTNLPVDADLGFVRQKIVPAAQSGVNVKFDAKLAHGAAVVVVRDDKGKYPKVGSVVRHEGSETESIVGYDGEIYIQDLQAQNTIVVTSADGTVCRASFPFEPRNSELIKIDNVTCR